MPLPEGTRYGMRPMKGGGMQRLAFKRGTNRVIEAKSMDTGRTHSAEDFRRDRKRRNARTTQRQSGRR